MFARLFILAALLVPTAAHATVDVYKNPQYGYQWNYPDSWMPQTETGGLPHSYRIVADEGRSTAWCEITSDDDRRFIIYPAKYQGDIMERELGPEFWMTWLSDNDNVIYLDVSERSGLGSGAATSIYVDYTRHDGKPERSFLAATIHGGVKYVAQCAAHPQEFAKYEKLFHSILATLKLKQAFHPFPHGFYRDWSKDKPIVYPLGEGVGSTAF